MANEEKRGHRQPEKDGVQDEPLDAKAAAERRSAQMWRSKTLAGLTESQSGLGSRSVPVKADALGEVILLIERMFTSFVKHAYAHNEKARGSTLEMSWDRPGPREEISEDWLRGTQKRILFAGRLSTCEWTMIVRGLNNEVIVHILPADKMFTFNANPASFNPYIKLVFADGSGFKIGNYELTAAMEDGFFSRLVESLERFARHQAKFNQAASLTQLGLKAASPEPVSEDAEAQKRRWEEEFFIDMNSAPDQGEALPGYLNQAKTGSISEWARQIKEGTDAAAKVSVLNDALAEKSFFQSGSQDFSDALEEFLGRLEDEIERIEKASSKAIKSQEWSNAEALFRLVSFLKNVRTESWTLMEEYEKLVTQANSG